MFQVGRTTPPSWGVQHRGAVQGVQWSAGIPVSAAGSTGARSGAIEGQPLFPARANSRGPVFHFVTLQRIEL